MTEADWLNELTTSQWMALHLCDCGVARTRAGRRKCRLLACGCCRFAWDMLLDDRLRDAIRIAELFADGLASKQELASARAAIAGLASDSGPFGKCRDEVRVAIDMAVAATDPRARSAAVYMTATTLPLAGRLPKQAGEAYLCRLFRCVFGNPFRPYVAPSSWPSTVVQLAAALYNGQDCSFALHDALLEAGHPELAQHFRDETWHPKGCWVVDLILNKN